MTPPLDVVRLAAFSLSAGGRVLLRDAALSVAPGTLCLLVGASGSGKSLTLSLLLGLHDRDAIRVEGEVSVLGSDPRVGGPPAGAAIVFQDFALFDDWDARANVAFAADHGEVPQAERAARVEELLSAFGVPGRARPATLSGGQKQRLATARALAARPKLVFYDEPTSGLDPAMSAEAARLIREAHDRHGMTSIVVTHDLAALAPVADRIVLLDPVARVFRDVASGEVDAALAALRSYRPPEPAPPTSRRAALRAPLDVLDGAGRAAIAFLQALVALVPRFPQARWGLRYFVFYARLFAFGAAAPFLALAGAVSGFIVAFFLYELIPFAGFTEPVATEEINGALGFALHRVVAPGTTALLFAARAGAAASADFGRRSMSRQVDALRTFQAPPERYLLSAALLAALVGTPLLWWLTLRCAAAAATLVFLATHPAHGAYAFEATFRSLVDDGALLSRHAAWSLGKTLVSAFGVIAVAWSTSVRRFDGG
ncbi:MAG TPA: ATP-binding cassette domain-containing protein, partial [Planctomycetota bacterium]|nr:ATP-binding cassette domain-containing protein [Planctomycetota bacterium]